MHYEDVVRDFAKRTRQNLRFIEASRSRGEDVFETTQLINSMLGLLVFPREEYLEQIPEIPVGELRELGWPVPRQSGKFDSVSDLRELVRYLRNAIAHFNLKFLADTNQQISGLRVWNVNRGRKTWEAELDLSDLSGIAEKFTALLLDESGPLHQRTADGG